MLKHIEFDGKVPDVSRSRKRNNLSVFLREFMVSGKKVEIVGWSDGKYKNVKSAQISLYRAVKNEGLPIDVMLRKDEIYLVNRSI